MISLQRLEGFYWVAKTGGYARAARAFPYPITQPGVFAQVRRLEEEVGVRLFDRVGKDAMVLTRSGRALFATVQPFYEGLPGVVRALGQSEDEGELLVDAGALEMVTIVPNWVRALRHVKPKVRVQLREIDEPSYERLLGGATDIIIEHQPSLPEGVAAKTIGTYHAYVAVPAAHRLAKRARVEASDLENERFVAFDLSTRQYEMQRHALAAAGANVNVVATATTVHALLALVGSGLGVSLVVWPSATAPKFANAKLIAVKGSGARLPMTAAFRKGTGARGLVAAALDAVPSA